MELFEYSQLFYNQVIYDVEQEWKRPLSDHEKHLLLIGYRYGRRVESENEIKILEVK